MKSAVLDFSQRRNGRHLIDLLKMPTTLNKVLPQCQLRPYHEDLVDVSRACYVADRFVRRHRDDEHTTERELHLIIPVREPHRWQNVRVQSRLRNALEFLTQDQWTFTFVDRVSPAVSFNSQPEALIASRQINTTLSYALYSGGADSTIGVLLNGVRDPQTTQVLIAASGNHLKHQQDLAFKQIGEALQDQGGKRPLGLTFETSVRHNVVRSLLNLEGTKKLREEYSQRTRGFLFISLGAVVAASSGGTGLQVFENGVGAINLPYSRASIGADHTRSMHPRFIFMMSEFLTELFENPFQIDNPFWFVTKGQMVAQAAQYQFGSILKETLSCERTPSRGIGPKPHTGVQGIHCGECTSCVLRQISFQAAGVVDSSYTQPMDTLPKENRQWLNLMAHQAEALRVAVQTDEQALVRLLRLNPDLRYAYDGLRLLGHTPANVETGLVGLYRMYASEWRRVQQGTPTVWA
ncbi:hypothetical protein GO986_07260 [Deinococcus sp. HMF7620]|uniref:7-cyano-7-deazaguanine synthase n=1 Tax=Deinococcus arboris TaxID=2682977 RepID=A0A7C9M1C9_9DEIO|nr:7-cyano-7-deazaguanine synthase [Deinococcus arboris]MVN86562.1 hypothetical protein [Deinococcus arboris]